MFFSIRGKIILTYIIIVVMVVTVIGTYMLGTLRNYLLEQRKLEVLTRANVIASLQLDEFDEIAIEKKMETMHVESGFRAMILDSQSRVYYDSYSEGSYRGKLYIYSSVTEVLLNGKDNAKFYKQEDGWIIEAAVPIIREGKTIGAVLVAANGESIDGIVEDIGRAILMFGMVLVVVVIIFGTTMAGFLTMPVVKMTKFIKNMPKDKLQKCGINSKDEIGELVVAFNELIGRIDELEGKRRAFVSDASHELKTPLSIIKLLSDSLIQTENPDPEFLREFLMDMNEEVERLTRIVQRLLDLTSMDQSHANMNVEVSSVSDITKEVYEKLLPLAKNKDIQLVFTRPEDDMSMPLERDSITEAIYNIADNSIKYTENGGTVKIELLRDLGNILIRISDTGIGIPKEEIQKIFDRFYRVDKARARDTGGTGLGLSIAMDVVKLHGGYIEVASEEEKGSIFTIVLPYDIGIVEDAPKLSTDDIPVQES